MSERKYRNPQVNLRIPATIKEQVTVIAKSNGRSLNAEMVAALEFWVSESDKRKQLNTTSILERLSNMEADISKIKTITSAKK